MKRYFLLTFVLLAATCVRAWAGGVALDSVHAARSGQTTLIKFELSGIPSFHFFALGSPPRAVLDMHATHDQWHVHPISIGAVKGLRMARHRDGTLRAVFDLRPGARLVNVSRQKGHTLVMRIDGGNNAAVSQHRLSDAPNSAGQAAISRHPSAAPSPHPTSLRAVLKARPIVVAIDPGHGGKDPGTTGPSGLREKTVTLAIAKILYNKLERTPHIHPILTRKRDVYVSLRKRVEIAQQHQADLFVSIHENAYYHDPHVDGGTCYILSTHGASDAEAAQLAKFENSADPALDGVKFTHDPTVNQVLTDLAQTASINAEYHLAHAIVSQFARFEPVYDRRVRRANFEVLRDPMIPSVLCETAFLSNPRQARELHYHRFRAEIASAIYQGILRYLHQDAPMRLQPSHPGEYMAKAGSAPSADAASHGISVRRPKAGNHLKRATLHVGERLKGPPVRQQHTPNADRGTAVTQVTAHHVKRGDTLSVLAQRYHTSVKRLERLNDLHGPSLQAGQTLWIPSGQRHLRQYVVQSGDTLSELAQSRGVTTRRLEKINHLDSADIRVGEVLNLPNT